MKWAIILAGGSGTRFWPASRASRPKQLLALGERPDEALLAATVRRIAPLVPSERVIVATGAHLVKATRELLPEVPRENVIAEPAARNTAPCIAWASAIVADRDPEATIMVLPADHAIADEDAFRGVLARAMGVAQAGAITTVGIEPTRPDTGYGYIQVGKKRDDGANDIVRFVEKPNRERAERFLASGDYLWNAGMFFFRADAMRTAIAAHAPPIAAGVEAILKGGPEALAEIFPALPSISIDHAVMEKAAWLAVVPGSFGWNDVGSWESAWELAAKDDAKNSAPEGAIVVDSRGVLVRDLSTAGSKKTIALVGVDDLVVVETDDALLVMPRSRAQDVRLVVEELKKRGSDRL